jgi:hypothetical protein
MIYRYYWNKRLFIRDTMHDEEPPLFLRTVRQWIGRRSRVNWPVWSPALNSLELWLWGHAKTLMHSAPINDLEVLQQRVENACQEIRVKPGIFDRVHTSVRWRAESYVEMCGNHTEHLLLRSHEHCPYLCRHRLLNICWLGLFCSFK